MNDSPIVLNDNDVNRVFGYTLKKTFAKYQKMKSNNQNDNVIKGIYDMLEDMRTDVTSVIHDKQYMRMYYPLDDAVRNKGRLTLISPFYVKHLSNLLRYARDAIVKHNISDDVLLPLNADIIGLTKRENEQNQYEDITQLILTSRNRIKNLELTVNIRKDIIWELMDRMIDACFGRLIRQYRQNNLKRVNDVTFRTEIAVKSEKKRKKE